MKQLKRIRKGDEFNPDQVNQLIDAIEELRKVKYAGGLESKWTSTGLKVWSTGRGEPGAPDTGFWARITGHQVQNAGPFFRWKYTFREVQKTALGYAGWTIKSDGIDDDAYNSIEYKNDGTDPLGNGVATGHLAQIDGSYAVQPAPTGVIVYMRPVEVDGQSVTEYWFQYENGVDGVCNP